MDIKKVNNFFGYSLYSIGALKIIVLGIAVLGFFTDIKLPEGATVLLGFFQIFVAIASIVMLIININKEKNTVKGYIYGLIALSIELVVPSFFMIFIVLSECSLYMLAGRIIVNASEPSNGKTKRNQEIAKNAEWFFDEKREQERENRIEESNDKENEKKAAEEKEIEINSISMSTILIIWIVAIAIILVVYLIIDMKNDKIEANPTNTITEQNIINIPNVNTDILLNTINKNTENNTTTSEDRIPVVDVLREDEKMQTDERLTAIANELNNSKSSAELFKQGYILTAIASENKINVYGSGEGYNTNITYTLSGNILWIELKQNDEEPVRELLEMLHAMFLLDSVGMAKGYPERTIINAFNDEKSKNYTFEKEGIEIKQNSETMNVLIKVDLNNDLSFLNNL